MEWQMFPCESRLSDEEQEDSPDLASLLEEIEEIVHVLETDQVPLEDAIRLFEKGMGRCREASCRLDEAEGVIQRLLKDPDTGEEFIVTVNEETGSMSRG